MSFRKNQSRKQIGFVGIVFLAIALIGIVVAAIAAMSRETPANSAREKIKMDSLVIMKQGADFKLAMDKMILAGGNPFDVWNTTDDGVLYFDDHPELNKDINFKPPASATWRNAASYELLDDYTEVNGISHRNLKLELTLFSKDHCQMINHLVAGKKLTDAVENYVEDIASAEGCYWWANPDYYIYFKYMVERQDEV